MNAKKLTNESLEDFAKKAIDKDANIRSGTANYANCKIGLYIGPNFLIGTDTKKEMYYYILGRANAF